MFDLEQAIADWRRQMKSAGIKSPVPLDELEMHLREEIERQMKSGLKEHQAFDAASLRIGDANVLKTEFAKHKDFSGLLEASKSAKINRILGILWLAGCSWSLSTVWQQLNQHPSAGSLPANTVLLVNIFVIIIYVAGILGSISLFWGAKWGRNIVRMLALLMAITCIAQILDFRMHAAWREWCGIVALFSLISIWLLHAPKDPDIRPNAAAK